MEGCGRNRIRGHAILGCRGGLFPTFHSHEIVRCSIRLWRLCLVAAIPNRLLFYYE